MHPIGAGAVGVVDYAHPFQEKTKVIQGDTPIDMGERALDNLFELGGAERPRAF
jgi:hypothetical protein